jgi:hypothetical protein
MKGNSEAAIDAVHDAGKDMEMHRVKRADTVGVKDDPVIGWAIAGGIGLGVAFGGWYIIAGGAEAGAAGGAAKVASKCCRSDYDIVG